MAASNVNVVVITGNLTRDPELRTPGRDRRLRAAGGGQQPPQRRPTGEWVDKPNYFDVTVWGAQGENCANYLSKGRPVAVEGRLDWREWEAKDGSGKRQAVRSSPTPSSSSARATARAAVAERQRRWRLQPRAATSPPTPRTSRAPPAGRRRRGRRHPVLGRRGAGTARAACEPGDL